MPRQPSQAEYRSARFNPINPQDRDVLAIVKELEDQGFNFKQIVSDAILRADGKTPEMYAAPMVTAQIITTYMDNVLAQFAQEIVTEIKRGGFRAVAETDEDEESSEKPSKFAQSFARSFLERQRRAMGDE